MLDYYFYLDWIRKNNVREKSLKTYQNYLLLTLLCLALYLPGIFSVPIIDRDSPHFAQASKQMLETGDYLHVNFQDKPRHLKPPGIYWLQAASVKLFSPVETKKPWPYRLPSVLGGLFAVLLTFAFARTIIEEKTALLGASLLASSILLIIESHLAITDAVLLATMVAMQGALCKIYIYARQNSQVINRENGTHKTISKPCSTQPWLMPFIFWFAMSLGILVKGLTPVIAGLTILGLWIADQDISWFKYAKPGWGILFLILFSLAWIVPLSVASGSNFLFDMIRQDLLPKVMGGQQSHGMPPGYFLVIFTFMFWPASLFCWHANVWGWRQRKHAVERFLFAWIFPTWITYELIPTKLPEYLLPVYPAIALLMAIAIMQVKNNPLKGLPLWLNRLQYGIWTLIAIGLASAFLLIPYYLQGHFVAAGIYASMAILIVTLVVLLLISKSRIQQAAAACVIGALFIFPVVFGSLLPKMTNLWVSQKIAKTLYQYAPHQISEKKPLLAIGYDEPSLVFALGTHNVLFTHANDAIKRLNAHSSEVVAVEQPWLHRFQEAALQNGLPLTLLKTIHGYDFSNGKWVTIALLKRKASLKSLSNAK